MRTLASGLRQRCGVGTDETNGEGAPSHHDTPAGRRPALSTAHLQKSRTQTVFKAVPAERPAAQPGRALFITVRRTSVTGSAAFTCSSLEQVGSFAPKRGGA